MKYVYGEGMPSNATVRRRTALFRPNKKTLEDDPRAGCLVEVTTVEMCRKVENSVINNRRVSILQVHGDWFENRGYAVFPVIVDYALDLN